jgi:DNA-binding NtrC family response regulator
MSPWGLEPICCSSLREARALLPDDSLSLIFCEEKLADGTYGDLLRGSGNPLRTRFVVISSAAELEQIYDEALNLGAFDIIASPCRKSDVQWMVIRAIQEETRRGGNKRRSQTEDIHAHDLHSERNNHAGKETSEGSE